MVTFDQINPAFVDADFPAFSEFMGGYDQDSQDLLSACSAYEDSASLVPRDQWKDFADAKQEAGGGCTALLSRIYNQGGEGSCVANACSQAHEINQGEQYGRDRVVPLSAISLYKRIGSSPRSGAMVSNGLKKMAGDGILPLNTDENKAKFKHTMQATGFYEKFPDGWKDTAKLFTAVEYHVVQSVEGIISALLNHHPVVVGRNGHSICYCDVLFKGNDINVIYANSWGKWGFGAGAFDYGFGLDTISNIKRSAGWAFALRTVEAQFATAA